MIGRLSLMCAICAAIWALFNYGVAHGDYKPNMGVGNAWGQDWGPAADKNCPASPYGQSPLKSERMNRPEPAWGRNGALAHGYWGDTQMSTEPNMAVCEWNAEHDNKHDIMQDRCWPLWKGQRNGASDIKHTCR